MPLSPSPALPPPLQPFPSSCCISPAAAGAAAPPSKPNAKSQRCSPPGSCAKAAGTPAAGLPCPQEQRAKGKAGTRSQQQRGQGGWKWGRSPPAIAVTGCLLGRRHTVWQSGVRAPLPGCGCPSGAAAPSGWRWAHSPSRARAEERRGVTGATGVWRGVGWSRRTAGSSLPFLRSAAAEGAGWGEGKAGQKEPPRPRGFESEPRPSREEGDWEGPRGLGWGDTRPPLLPPGRH